MPYCYVNCINASQLAKLCFIANQRVNLLKKGWAQSWKALVQYHKADTLGCPHSRSQCPHEAKSGGTSTDAEMSTNKLGNSEHMYAVHAVSTFSCQLVSKLASCKYRKARHANKRCAHHHNTAFFANFQRRGCTDIDRSVGDYEELKLSDIPIKRERHRA